jgi:hypothetical protein
VPSVGTGGRIEGVGDDREAGRRILLVEGDNAILM